MWTCAHAASGVQLSSAPLLHPQQVPCLQGAAHIMVQRSAQLEADLDQTAAMLCDEMTQGAKNNAAMVKLQELYALEQKHCTLALTALSGLNIQCCTHNQEVRQCNEQLSAALVGFNVLLEYQGAYMSVKMFKC